MDMKKIIFGLVGLACLYPIGSLLAAGPSDYIITTFSQTTFSKTIINNNDVFYATIKSKGVCIQDVPKISLANRFTFRYFATNKSTGKNVILNSSYISTIEPFPNKVGESYEKTSDVPLQFPVESPAGEYTVSEENIKVEMKDPVLGWQLAPEPTKPAAPTQPVAPTQPTAPTKPAAPTGTDTSAGTMTKPAKPAEPTQPSEPTRPAEPTAPTPPPKIREIGTVTYSPVSVSESDLNSKPNLISTFNKAPSSVVAVSSLTITPDSVVSGTSVVGTVTLSKVAPAGGLTVRLYANYPTTVLIPASVKVEGGASSGTFKFQSKWVSTPMEVTITAMLFQSSKTTLSQKTVVLKITPPMAISALTLSPSSVLNGGSSIGTVTLGVPASANGQVITLTATPNDSLSLPGKIAVKAGATSGTFDIKTKTVNTPINVAIVATLNNFKKTISLTINPTPGPCSYSCQSAPQGSRGAVATCNNNETAQPWMTCPQSTQFYRCGFFGWSKCSAQVDAICCKPK